MAYLPKFESVTVCTIRERANDCNARTIHCGSVLPNGKIAIAFTRPDSGGARDVLCYYPDGMNGGEYTVWTMTLDGECWFGSYFQTFAEAVAVFAERCHAYGNASPINEIV